MSYVFLEALRNAELERFYPNFVTKGIRSIDKLSTLTMQDYAELGVTTMDDRRRLFQLIHRIKNSAEAVNRGQSLDVINNVDEEISPKFISHSVNDIPIQKLSPLLNYNSNIQQQQHQQQQQQAQMQQQQLFLLQQQRQRMQQLQQMQQQQSQIGTHGHGYSSQNTPLNHNLPRHHQQQQQQNSYIQTNRYSMVPGTLIPDAQKLGGATTQSGRINNLQHQRPHSVMLSGNSYGSTVQNELQGPEFASSFSSNHNKDLSHQQLQQPTHNNLQQQQQRQINSIQGNHKIPPLTNAQRNLPSTQTQGHYSSQILSPARSNELGSSNSLVSQSMGGSLGNLVNSSKTSGNLRTQNHDRDLPNRRANSPKNVPVSGLSERIRVCVRKRPLNRKERAAKENDVTSVTSKNSVVINEQKLKVDLTKFVEQHTFFFDEVIDVDATNEEVYARTAQPLVEYIFTGGKATCFAYGQTGSGKTYTMLDGEHGLYVQAARDIFRYLLMGEHAELTAWVSFFEIYQGQLYDLLNERKRIYAREDGNQTVRIMGIADMRVNSVSELLKIFDVGNQVRSTGSTVANADSSRSHAILQITLKTLLAGGKTRSHGMFSFIDLAGSERGADRGDADSKTRMEGSEINKSLLALKECIRSLDQESKHTPFRQSKLTQVLKDSFIGNSRTCMIATVSPNVSNAEHTLNTLRYADRVKELKSALNENVSSGSPLASKKRELVAQQSTTINNSSRTSLSSNFGSTSTVDLRYQTTYEGTSGVQKSSNEPVSGSRIANSLHKNNSSPSANEELDDEQQRYIGGRPGIYSNDHRGNVKQRIQNRSVIPNVQKTSAIIPQTEDEEEDFLMDEQFPNDSLLGTGSSSDNDDYDMATSSIIPPNPNNILFQNRSESARRYNNGWSTQNPSSSSSNSTSVSGPTPTPTPTPMGTPSSMMSPIDSNKSGKSVVNTEEKTEKLKQTQPPLFEGLIAKHRQHMRVIYDLLKSETRLLAQFTLAISNIRDNEEISRGERSSGGSASTINLDQQISSIEVTSEMCREPLDSYMADLDLMLAQEELSATALRGLISEARNL